MEGWKAGTLTIGEKDVAWFLVGHDWGELFYDSREWSGAISMVVACGERVELGFTVDLSRDDVREAIWGGKELL